MIALRRKGMGMAFCDNCSTETPRNATYCPRCGQEVLADSVQVADEEDVGCHDEDDESARRRMKLTTSHRRSFRRKKRRRGTGHSTPQMPGCRYA